MECPLCGHRKFVKHGQVKYEKARQGKQIYECSACHTIFTDDTSDRVEKEFTLPEVNLLSPINRKSSSVNRSIKSSADKAQELFNKFNLNLQVSASVLELSRDFGIVLGFTLLQALWMTLFTSLKVGLLNLIPTFLVLAIWYLFVKVEFNAQPFKKYFWQFFLLMFILTLRLPATISRNLEPLNWIIYFVIVGLSLFRIFEYFKLRKKLILLIFTSLLILYNSFSHISSNSPYTYVPGVAVNYPFACPHEHSEFMVNCDLNHFTALERIFVEPNFDASFSKTLRRFFFGYLSSLIGFDGHRWVASFSLNLIFWLFACSALYKTCITFDLSTRGASIAILSCASSWGFISFVGQSAMHVASYAISAIMIWATLEIIHTKNLKKMALMSLLILIGSPIYDIYHITLACVLTLFVFGKKAVSVAILSIQILIGILWNEFFLKQILGTIGWQENIDFIANSIKTWYILFTHLDVAGILGFLWKGTESVIYGGMIFGALASLIYLLDLWNRYRSKQEPNSFLPLVLSSSIVFLVLLSVILVAPETMRWSPTGTLPRLTFYTYPIFTIALAAIADRFSKNYYAYGGVVITFLFANLDITGIVSMSSFFDYGLFGIYWKP
jgi:Zn-finger protein